MTTMTLEQELQAKGWTQDDRGTWQRPNGVGREHGHSQVCTVESCGPDALFFCGPICIRAIRRTLARTIDDIPSPRPRCEGHRVPSREQLIRYALDRKGKREAAPAGTPLEDEPTTNTWSAERDDVAHAKGGTR